MPTLPSAAREGLSGPFEGKGKEEKYRGVLMLSREARLFVYNWLNTHCRIHLTPGCLGEFTSQGHYFPPPEVSWEITQLVLP